MESHQTGTDAGAVYHRSEGLHRIFTIRKVHGGHSGKQGSFPDPGKNPTLNSIGGVGSDRVNSRKGGLGEMSGFCGTDLHIIPWVRWA